jgi:DNA-binding CsgD family transcriptional regulator
MYISCNFYRDFLFDFLFCSIYSSSYALASKLLSKMRSGISTRAEKFPARLSRLTPVETQVANLVKRGRKTGEITQIMHLSAGTISNHRMFQLVFSGQIDVRNNDVRLIPEKQPPFELSEEIRANEAFISVWNTSDLSSIITRFSEAAEHHYLRLAKNMKKTEARIRIQGM